MSILPCGISSKESCDGLSDSLLTAFFELLLGTLFGPRNFYDEHLYVTNQLDSS